MYKVEHVSVFGYSETLPNEELYKTVSSISQKLAEAGFTIVNGGGPGVMRASSEGAKAGGGKTIGVTFYPEDATNYEGRDPQNHLDEEIKCENYVERTLRLLEIGDVYLMFNGGTGTISEFAMAWGLSQIYYGHNKPILLYGEFWEDIIKAFARNMILRRDEKKVYQVVSNATEVIQAIENFEKSMESTGHLHPSLDDEDEALYV